MGGAFLDSVSGLRVWSNTLMLGRQGESFTLPYLELTRSHLRPVAQKAPDLHKAPYHRAYVSVDDEG